MAEVLCDTSFLIHLATKRILNIDRIGTEIGHISFVVPKVVQNELISLQKKHSKRQDATDTLNYIKNFKILELSGTFADKEILEYVSKNSMIVATMDKELKKQVRSHGCPILSFSKDKIILES